MKIGRIESRGLTDLKIIIMKIRLFQYIENFTTKNWKFQVKILIIFIFLLQT